MSELSAQRKLEILEWVKSFVDSHSGPREIEDWARPVTDRIVVESPELMADEALAQMVHATVRSHWSAFLTAVTEPTFEVHLVAPARELAAALAERGIHLTALFRFYRLGQQGTWEFFSGLAERPDLPLDPAEVLVFLWDRASAWLDGSVEASVDIYQEVRDRIERGADARRLELVGKVLAGEPFETNHLSAELGGYGFAAFSTALVLQATETGAVAELAAAASRLAGSVNVRQPLVIRPGGHELWCWLATRTSIEADAFADSVDWLAERGIIACVGSSLEDIAGFALSHREAREAQKLALRATRPPTVIRYPEVEMLTLAAEAPERAERFVRRALGGLAADDEASTRLRETLEVALRASSIEEAATILNVHKNTVRYRVAQAEKHLGRSSSRSAEVEFALRYYAVFLQS